MPLAPLLCGLDDGGLLGTLPCPPISSGKYLSNSLSSRELLVDSEPPVLSSLLSPPSWSLLFSAYWKAVPSSSSPDDRDRKMTAPSSSSSVLFWPFPCALLVWPPPIGIGKGGIVISSLPCFVLLLLRRLVLKFRFASCCCCRVDASVPFCLLRR